jgi:single-strand DNA-binding protein
MANLNKVFLIGNLTADPELRYTPNGTAVADLRLAVNRRFTSKEGEQKEETAFVDVVVWQRQAENCSQYLSKGRSVMVEGRLKLDSWENQQGEKRSKLRVVGENVQFLGGRPQERPDDRQSGVKRGSSDEGMPAGEDIGEDDIPF